MPTCLSVFGALALFIDHYKALNWGCKCETITMSCSGEKGAALLGQSQNERQDEIVNVTLSQCVTLLNAP